MRILVPACAGLAVASCIVSTLLWRELRADRQVIAELHRELTAARVALAAKPAGLPGNAIAGALPQPSAPVQAAVAQSPAVPANITREAAVAALTEDTIKRQKALMADAEYRKALLAQARADLQQRYAGLRVELGLSEQELNALFDLLADAQGKAMTTMAATADSAPPDAAAMAEMGRQMEAQQQQLKDSITALIGPERYAQFEEYDRIQPSRTRVNNLGNLLARSGRPLSNAQTRSLTAVMVGEQKRMEAEAQALRAAGQADTRTPADIQAETNRRLLEQVPKFLDGQQVQVVRGRFEQRATIDRAADRLQQRERELLRESPN